RQAPARGRDRREERATAAGRHAASDAVPPARARLPGRARGMIRRLPPRLVALTPGDLAPEHPDGRARFEPFLARARAAIAAGLQGILLREPDLSDRETLELGRALREAIPSGGWLGLHDRVHLAGACEAD